MQMLDELVNQLATLVGTLKVEDLDDPKIAVCVSQLVSILDSKPELLPQRLIEHLLTVENKVERFKQAASQLSEVDSDKLNQLATSMREAGLLQ